MAEFPALPLWTDALAADTDHLSHEEYGLYQRMLNVAWRMPSCDLPNDPAWLMRRFRLSADEFERICQPIIAEFWRVNSRKRIEQKRLKKERAFVEKNRQKQTSRAKSRWNKEKHPCRGNATVCNAPTPTPTPTPITTKQQDSTPTTDPDSAARASRYAFESGVIKLTREDLDRWCDSFGNIDVKAELIGLADWAGRQPKWFPAVSGALAKKNRQAKAANDAVDSSPVSGLKRFGTGADGRPQYTDGQFIFDEDGNNIGW